MGEKRRRIGLQLELMAGLGGMRWAGGHQAGHRDPQPCAHRAPLRSQHCRGIAAPLLRSFYCALLRCGFDLHRASLFFCGVDTLALNKRRVRCRVLTYSVQTGSNKIFELPVEFPSLQLHLAETRLCHAAALVQRLSHPREAEGGEGNSWELCGAV